eukprot:TRINITY_DN17947_c0_g1_i3.p3 TRINITY_DN17947_c0_g1~~TRINITY_DN17947_c0_g1_i3.p3  ORF type:complete len:111 (-),score=2.43 TRINITY_DN17947_c0_g1_i3:81-413(-)
MYNLKAFNSQYLEISGLDDRSRLESVKFDQFVDRAYISYCSLADYSRAFLKNLNSQQLERSDSDNRSRLESDKFSQFVEGAYFCQYYLVEYLRSFKVYFKNFQFTITREK